MLLASTLLAVLLGAPPAAHAGREDGEILLPVFHDTVPRALYLLDRSLNGLTGYVVDLPGVVPNGASVVLRDTSPEPVEMDVLFYWSINGEVEICTDNTRNASARHEEGSVECIGRPGARWAIVTMLYGLGGEFRLEWN